jgi:hypothetical protein
VAIFDEVTPGKKCSAWMMQNSCSSTLLSSPARQAIVPGCRRVRAVGEWQAVVPFTAAAA